MDGSQKVSILMAKYNTLRAEVFAARSYVAQAIGITAAVMMGVVGIQLFHKPLGTQMSPMVYSRDRTCVLGRHSRME